MVVKANGILGRDKQLYKVDPREIFVNESENYRKEYGDIEALAQNILENGLIDPVHVRKAKDDNLHLVFGFRRMRAIRRLMQTGNDIKSIPVFIEEKGISEINILLRNINSNEGLAPTPLELLDAYSRLHNFGLSQKDIAKKIGKSSSHVSQILALKNAGTDLQNVVTNKEIPLLAAIQIVKDSNGNLENQKNAIQTEKERKKAEREQKKLEKAQQKAERERKKAEKDRRVQNNFKDIVGFKAAPPPVFEERVTGQSADFQYVIDQVRDEINQYTQGQNIDILEKDIEVILEELANFTAFLETVK